MTCLKRVLFCGFVLWLITTAFAGALEACELRMEVVENRLHVQVICSNRLRHRDRLRVETADPCTESHIDEIERIDQIGYLVHTSCGAKKTTLVFQLTDKDTLLVTSPENY
jgi:hypothetical protein